MKKQNERGRSMIEMLGVLAIIGVLSVGGIAGFSKAMEKYRVNKTIQQVTMIAGNIRTLFGSQRNYENLGTSIDGNNNYAFLRKLNVIPGEMYDDSSMSGLSSPFGGIVQIFSSSLYDGNEKDFKAFVIEYEQVPQDACIALATQDWETESLIAVMINAWKNNKTHIS